MQSFSISSYPKAILHVDGDAFFVGCEMAKDPSLKGRVVVTGKERGIASAFSYEAKARGVKRGMRLSEIKKLCPDVVILPSDYETYSLYSKRMYDIVRRYTPDVEEYSIDECFADLTGLRSFNNMSYEEMAAAVKHDLDSELGMTFSVGLAPNKVLSKVASKWEKPSGLVFIPAKLIHEFISKTPIEKIWGIGPQTSALLNRFGIKTAYEFAMRDESWVAGHLAKPYVEIWHELRGNFIYELSPEEKHDYQSISKAKTFTPPSRDKAFVFSQLSKNIENACIKARRHNLATRDVVFMLKTQDFKYRSYEIKLSRATAIPNDIIALVKEHFSDVYEDGAEYRATGVVLAKLIENTTIERDLFGESLKSESFGRIFEALDELSEKFGKHTVFLGSSFSAMTAPSHKGDRNDIAGRLKNLFKGETKRKRLGIPLLGFVR